MVRLVVIFLAVVAASSPGLLARDVPDAEMILDTMVEKIGGKERLSKVKNLRLVGRGNWIGIEELEEGDITEVYQGLRLARILIDYKNFGKAESGSDGKIVWERSDLGVTIREGWNASENYRRFGRVQNLDWNSMYKEAKSDGMEEIDGVPHYRLSLAPKPLSPLTGPKEKVNPSLPDTWYVNASTYLLSRVVARSLGGQGDEIKTVVEYDNWKDVGGILYAYQRRVTISDFTFVMDFDKIEQNVSLEENFFEADKEIHMAASGKQSGTQQVEEIRIEELEPKDIASIRVQCSMAEMQKQLSMILPEAMRHVVSEGAQMTGPPLVRYHHFGDPLDIEGAMPLAAPIKTKGRVKAETLPGGKCVVAWHVGPYHTLGETHEKIKAFLGDNGLEMREPCWEEYWTDPGVEPDQSKWRTKIVWPVKEKTK